MKEIRVAIVGFGGIARVHYAAYEQLRQEGLAVQVVAICEKEPSRIFQSVEINLGSSNVTVREDIRIYSDIEQLLEEDFDIADLCLPTFLHKSISIKLLEAGKHVLCEKPMALSSEECAKMLEAAEVSRKRLMIGQCLRFDTLYQYLKRCIDEKTFGELRYLKLERHCDFPTWATDFNSMERTGGCILDTHIHDIDMARFLLGEPCAVSCVQFVRPKCQIVNSRLYYRNAVVIADTAWDEARQIPFASGFRARFESGSVDCDGEKITVKPMGEQAFCPQLPSKDRMVEELRLFIELVIDADLKNGMNAPESAMQSVCLVEQLKESAARQGTTELYHCGRN